MKVIDGGKDKPRPRGEIYTWTCHICSSASLLEIMTGSLMVNGVLRGGSRQFVCADCFVRGRTVMVAERRKPVKMSFDEATD